MNLVRQDPQVMRQASGVPHDAGAGLGMAARVGLGCSVPGLLAPAPFPYAHQQPLSPPQLLPATSSWSVPACATQGALSVDYGGLQVLLPAAVQQLLADRQELKKAQSTMQLTVLGQMQELAEAVKVLQLAAVASSCSSSETAAAASTASSSASGSSAMLAGMAGEEDQDEASLAFLMDGGDVEMESSVGEAEEAWAQDDSSSPPSNDFAALTDEQATDFLMQRLAEQPGARKLYMVSSRGWGGNCWVATVASSSGWR